MGAFTTTLIWMAAAGPLETVVLVSLAVWMAFYVVNHAEMTVRLRETALPLLPKWLAYPLTCAICFGWWVMAAFSLLTGFTPLLLLVPPVTLLIDLAYQRLRPNERPTTPSPPP